MRGTDHYPQSRFGERPEMTQRSNFLTKTLFLSMILALGCSKGGGQGCSGGGDETVSDSLSGSDSASGSDSVSDSDSAGDSAGGAAKAASVDSKLLGVYKLNRYQGSQDSCDQLADIVGGPGHLVLYAFHPTSKPEESRLGGAFCGDLGKCRAFAARGTEPAVGYSFIDGDDIAGWRGWAILDAGATDDERCRAAVQSHVLISTDEDSIKIETTTNEVVFDPRLAEADDEGNATCAHRDAINATSAALPCKSYLLVEARRESSL